MLLLQLYAIDLFLTESFYLFGIIQVYMRVPPHFCFFQLFFSLEEFTDLTD